MQCSKTAQQFLGMALVAIANGVAFAEEPALLPNTKPFMRSGDVSAQMHEAAHRDMEAVIAKSLQTRAQLWKRDLSAANAYERSISANRQRFQEIIGLVDKRTPAALERFGDDDNPALVAETKEFRAFQVRWPALEGVYGEGLLLEPTGPALGLVRIRLGNSLSSQGLETG